jgi:hypothetical protein
MDPWIGPAIVAAIVSGLVSALGWFVNSWQTRVIEQRRREEKVHDFQVALHAEIASDRVSMSVIDRAAFLEEIKARYAANSGYSVVVPHMASNLVFAAIVGEIHVLPGGVIAPVVDYARLRQTVEQFVVDLRADKFSQLPADRQLTMYSDYLQMLGRLEQLAKRAELALFNSLNSPDGAPSSQLSAAELAGPAAVSVARKDEP